AHSDVLKLLAGVLSTEMLLKLEHAVKGHLTPITMCVDSVDAQRHFTMRSFTCLSYFTGSNSPFNAIEEFKGQYRCITADLRNAIGGQSTGPLEADRPWESYADDQLGLMDHLGIDKFMVMGFCI